MTAHPAVPSCQRAIPRRFNSAYIPQSIQASTLSREETGSHAERLQPDATSIGETERRVGTVTGQQRYGIHAEASPEVSSITGHRASIDAQRSHQKYDSRVAVKSTSVDRLPSANEDSPQQIRQPCLEGTPSPSLSNPFATLVTQGFVQHFEQVRVAPTEQSRKRPRQEHEIVDGRKRLKTDRKVAANADPASTNRRRSKIAWEGLCRKLMTQLAMQEPERLSGHPQTRPRVDQRCIWFPMSTLSSSLNTRQ